MRHPWTYRVYGPDPSAPPSPAHEFWPRGNEINGVDTDLPAACTDCGSAEITKHAQSWPLAWWIWYCNACPAWEATLGGVGDDIQKSRRICTSIKTWLVSQGTPRAMALIAEI